MTEKEIRILMLEDSPTDAELIERELGTAGIAFRVKRVDTREDFIGALESFHPTMILSDYSLPAFDGASALVIARSKVPDIPFIYVSGHIGEERAIDALHNGATDYVLKNKMGRLAPAVQRAMREIEERSARRWAQEETLKSELRFRTLIENSADGIALLDADRIITYASSAATRILGYHAEEMLGKHIIDFVHSPERRRSLRFFQLINEKRDAPFILSSRFHHKDGSVRWLEGIAKNLLADPSVNAIVLNFRDITERKQAEEALKLQTSYFQQLFENSPAGIVMFDNDVRVVDANKAFESLFQYSLQEIRGINIQDLIVPSTYVAESTQLIQATYQGETISRITTRKKKDGSWVQVRILMYPILVDNRQLGVFSMYLDLTEQQQLQEQLLRTQRLESIGTLASGIAHDLNNVLAPIMMVIRILQDSIEDHSKKKLLDTVEKSIQRGADIIKQVLLFSRGVRGNLTVLDPGSVVREVENIIRETFPKDIHLRVSIPAKILCVNGDSTQLHQVLLNICVNARDAMQNGGTLTLKVETIEFGVGDTQIHPDAKPGQYVVFIIRDNGTGIPKEIVDKIFDPFYTTKELGKGTGLGLSTSLGIVKSHHGFITVSTSRNKGSEFKVYLPAVASDEPELAAEGAGESLAGNEELILLVDDETAITDIGKYTLEASGYHVIVAADGEQAVSVFRQYQDEVRIVITDISMPILDGHSMIKAIRTIEPKTKFLVISGLVNDKEFKKIREEHIFASLTKPFTANQLLQSVYSVLHDEA
jgi:PAS domain S-box-containing protein